MRHLIVSAFARAIANSAPAGRAPCRARASVLRNRPYAWRRLLLLVCGITLAKVSHAQTTPNPADEQRRQQERVQEQRGVLEAKPDVRLPGPAPAASGRLALNETPCFRIEHIDIKTITHSASTTAETSAFDWLAKSLAGADEDDSPLGRCLGTQGIALLIKRAQDALIARGFVTSRVLAPSQNLQSGTLMLTVIPGRIARIVPARPEDERRVAYWNAVATREGDILNLRDIEQTLENLKRVPTAEVDIKIAPADQPGQSDLLIDHQQGRLARLTLTADDSGSKTTGKYQGSATLSLDNLLALSDLFYFTRNNDLGGGDPGSRGTRGHVVHYSMPWGYWAFGLTISENSYYQTVTGSTTSYIYSGSSGSTELKASRLFYRDANTKDTVYLKATERHSRNFINDTEVLIQRRASALWELGLEHKAFIGRGTLQASVAHKRGTRDFGAIDAPEEASGTGTARPSFYGADVFWSTPWTPWQAPLVYQVHMRLQATDMALAAPDRFALGGRHTVRGFDGENSLSGDAGWLLRQDLQWNLGQTGSQIYLALDVGEVDGPNTAGLPDRFMAGTALGWRVQYKTFQLDTFVGRPVHTPPTVRTSASTAGFSMSFTL